MPVPPTLTSYLPVLLASVSNTAVPDDSDVSTQPQGQVDYLSHQWREEDVWRSWRNMTRQKNAIANGMRLENASWRTWWKQRNKLKTISPETLNWLKDSDVTWLYGPLHVGSDWEDSSESKPKQQSPRRQNSFDTVQHPSPPPPAPTVTKPILKHRSISQLLSLPPSPFFDHEEEDIEPEEEELEDEDEPPRPPLLHTKSDTHISWRSRLYRKDSPPRILSHEHPHAHRPTPSAPSSESSNSTSSDPELCAGSGVGADACVDASGNGGKKRHISFNTFVEQYIAIDKPKPKRRSFVGSRQNLFQNSMTQHGYDDGSEVIYDHEYDQPSSFFLDERGEDDLGSDSEEDDDVLEIRTSSSRSRSSSSSRSRHSKLNPSSNPRQSAPIRNRPSLVRAVSSDRERVTIAPIAPAMLKTSGVEDDDDPDVIGPEGNITPVPKEVELVYLPPSNSIYSLPSTPLLTAGEVGYPPNRDSYFGSVGRKSSLSAGSSPMMVNQTLADPIPQDPSKNILASGLYSYFGDRRVVDSPVNTDDVAIRREGGDAYDYFGGPDLGEEYTEQRSNTMRRKRSLTDENDDDDGGGGGRGLVRYAHGGAASVPTGRSSGGPSSPRIPSVIVNDVVCGGSHQVPEGGQEEGAVATERKEEDHSPMSTSPTEMACGVIPINVQASPIQEAMEKLGPPFMQTPASDSPISRLGIGHPPPSSSSSATRQDSDPSLLSAPDAVPTRGRSQLCSTTSHSGSTTTGSYSYSSDSRSESRGRSSTRNSSFSDPDRSGSRSSRGTSSPLGSISPTGSSIAIGGYGQSRGRDRDIRFGGERKVLKSREDVERGRERTGRRLENSLSPPHGMGSPARCASDVEVYQPYTPELIEARLASRVVSSSPPSSVSGSSTISASSSNLSGSSTASEATVGPIAAPVPQGPTDSDVTVVPRHRVGSSSARASAITIPSPIPEEDEVRTCQSTPVSSPTLTFRPVPAVLQSGPTSPNHSIKLPKSPILQPVTSPSEATAVSSSPTSSGFRGISFRGGAFEGVEGASHVQQVNGTLVGRAADIVSSARGFLGAIWSASS